VSGAGARPCDLLALPTHSLSNSPLPKSRRQPPPATFPALQLLRSPFFPHSQHLAPPDLRAGVAQRSALHTQLLATCGSPQAPRVHPLPPPAHPHQGMCRDRGPVGGRAVRSPGTRALTRCPLSAALLLGRRQPHALPQPPRQRSAHGLRAPLRPQRTIPSAIKM
jgi:hypothetical protein